MCFDSFYTSRNDTIDRKLEEIRETPFEVHQINAINVVFSHVARNPVKIELEFEEWQFREP